jgi:hypothetical protein
MTQNKSKQVKMTSRMEIHYNGSETIESNRNSIQGGIEISPFDKRIQTYGNEEQSREAKSPIQTIKEYQVLQKQNDYSERSDDAIQSVDYDSLGASMEKYLPDELIVTNQSNQPYSQSFPIKRSIGRPSAVNLLSTLLHKKDSTSKELEKRNKMLSSFVDLVIGNQPGQTMEYSTNSQEHLQQHADQQNNDQQTVYETPMLQCEMNTVININLSIQNPGINILINLNQHNQVIGQNWMIPLVINNQNLITSEEQTTSNLPVDIIANANDHNTVVST